MEESLHDELAATAARLIVEEGLDYGAAKRRAARDLGLSERRAKLPDNLQVETAVREYLALFHADTQPGELAELRRIALVWMDRLETFRPLVCGAVWRGTATRLSPIHLELYCDDPKAAELLLLDRGINYEVGSAPGPRGGRVDVLSLAEHSPGLDDWITLHLSVLDLDDLRGALRVESGGQPWRGSRAALARRADDAARAGAPHLDPGKAA